MRDDIKSIKDALNGRIEDLCAQLLPHGRRENGQWVASNPFVAGDDRKLPALKVGMARDAGAWRDWRNGDHGDVIDLIAFAQRTDRSGALRWARDFLGLAKMSADERRAMQKAAAEAGQRRAAAAAKAESFKLLEADRLFSRALKMGEGGAAEAHGRAYFAARGCALEDVASLNRYSFRFAGISEWWKGAKWQTDAQGRRIKTASGPEFPAVHSAMRGPTGAIACCHVTFLDPLLAQKAPVVPAKLMFGVAKGAVIEAACGPSGRPYWMTDGSQSGPLIVAEGIETALSLAVAIPEARVWAAGSLAGIGHVPAGLDCVASILVARDNNFGNKQAQSQLDAGLELLAQHGKSLDVMASHLGDDFNDLMTGKD